MACTSCGGERVVTDPDDGAAFADAPDRPTAELAWTDAPEDAEGDVVVTEAPEAASISEPSVELSVSWGTALLLLALLVIVYLVWSLGTRWRAS